MARQATITQPVEIQTHTVRAGGRIVAAGVIVEVLGGQQYRVIVPHGCRIDVEKSAARDLESAVEHTVPQ